MIIRWISDVPSQIRSTRSSRRKRSGGELAHVAPTAEDLDDPVGAAPGRLRREQLGQRRLGVDDLADRRRVSASQAHSRVSRRAADGVGGRIGQREADSLEVVDPLAELDPLRWPTRPPASSSRSIAPEQRAPMWIRSSTNHSLVSSSAPPDAAEDRRRRDADVGQHELRMAVGERVGVVGVVLDGDARRVVVDQEQGRQPARRRRRQGSGRS